MATAKTYVFFLKRGLCVAGGEGRWTPSTCLGLSYNRPGRQQNRGTAPGHLSNPRLPPLQPGPRAPRPAELPSDPLPSKPPWGRSPQQRSRGQMTISPRQLWEAWQACWNRFIFTQSVPSWLNAAAGGKPEPTAFLQSGLCCLPSSFTSIWGTAAQNNFTCFQNSRESFPLARVCTSLHYSKTRTQSSSVLPPWLIPSNRKQQTVVTGLSSLSLHELLDARKRDLPLLNTTGNQ